MNTAWRTAIPLLLLMAFPALGGDRPYLREAKEIAALRKGWTKEAQEKVRAKWRRYLDTSDDDLWAMLPGPKVYRSMGVNRTEGCPKCGKAAYKAGGLWPFKCDMWKKPWKVTCPSCGEVFPKNDFAAFYRSGLGRDRLFDPDRADRKLLFNTEHPDPKDPLHTYGVDDGTGWVDAKGNRFWFIARYCGYLWVQVTKDARAMAEDYQRTGAPELAHKAAVLLARMADFYPQMDYSTQGTHCGTYKLGGDRGKAIWACGPTSEAVRMRRMLATYDDIWEIFGQDKELVTFLTRKSREIGRPQWGGSAEAVRKHIEEHLIAEGARDVIRDRASGSCRYGGDVGHMAWTIALQGLVVDDKTLRAELLAWPFEGPYPLKGGMHEVLNGPIIGREGAGGSASPGYSRTHYTMARTLADIYAKLPPPFHRDLYAQYPCIQKSYDTQFALDCCERYYPHIGDCGKCGTPGLICRPATMLEAFEKFGAPRYARMAYFLNRHSTKKFPEGIAEKVKAIVKEHGDWKQVSTNLNGYGLAILRSGEALEDQRAAWMYYGCAVTNSHTHLDRLNIGLFAKGLNLMPDMGYPERTGVWPKRVAWTNNTISHNTVVVDRLRQKRVTVGNMQTFCVSPKVQLIDVAREAVYPQTSLYRRVYAMVELSEHDSYLVDIFRVKGGEEHHYSFHSAEGDVVTEGLKLVAQEKGTLAGPDVPFGRVEARKRGWWAEKGVGFQFLRDVERDARPPDCWNVTWRIKDTWNVFRKGKRAETDVRLRLTMLGNNDEVILATAEPPRLGKLDNPETLKYLLVHNSGRDVASVFVSVIEPFVGESKLASINRVPVEPSTDDIEGMEAVALAIQHTDGTMDTVFSAHDGSVLRKAGAFEFAAEWAFARVRDGRVVYALLVGGTKLTGKGLCIEAPTAFMTGTITDMDREMDDHNCITTDAELPVGDTLAGSWMRIANDGKQDACYEIRSVRREKGRTVIDLGDITFIRQVKDPKNYDAGYIYNFEVGQTFAVPSWAWARLGSDGKWEFRSNCGAKVVVP
ncbi:MAG: hypothetical protein GXP25_01585 [Planctomycetes bacterium]|nr:hypothetical protein [Planctomycetota bacterium]